MRAGPPELTAGEGPPRLRRPRRTSRRSGQLRDRARERVGDPPFDELLRDAERPRLEEPERVRDDDEPLRLVDREPLERDPLERDPLEREPVDRDPVERDPVERELLDREPLEREPVDRDPLDRDPVERDPLERELLDRELLERERLDEDALRRVDERRRLVVRRSDAGISAVATALTSVGICFARKSRIRSSSRRMRFAS